MRRTKGLQLAALAVASPSERVARPVRGLVACRQHLTDALDQCLGAGEQAFPGLHVADARQTWDGIQAV